ncbi:ATP-dependent helicase [Anaerotignum lactatifermentans]|uniref:DNA 3'-5' helicase n=1 Tax=Anaerotignum lactatifermentans TaxID=160404 RepID=A0ABS2GAJ5_9FIRM|nr:ATP-dependent helicase [Anaerotignum lactatifermentans]MBM6829445.1 ATP-dependent helicase [Anaerotignum lactatifermentans]MBM6877803.1 ATP-dependent helicase [Anaerotignum lactatifermentans]MBM6951022.1 ATP-dependent helicase [Anaerotignum lactatifermentans]
MEMKFNENQKKAILHGEGPMLVLAGPGSGKTTVIVHRLRHMTETMGIDPRSILVITFSKAAAEQMKSRYFALKGRTGVLFGTFHSVFFRILRRAYGYQVEQVLQEEEKKGCLRQLLRDGHISAADEEEYLEQFLNQLSLMKNELKDLESFQPEGLPQEEFRFLAKGYASYKRRVEKLDFDDMLTECYTLLRQDTNSLRYWQTRFAYILADEFQDVNQAQYQVLKLLAAPQNNLFVVGDDDQSIYGFRGARPEFMLEFPKAYPQAARVTLDTNYRSSGRIIRLAEQVIAFNTYRFAKGMRGIGGEGDKISVFSARDAAQEAELVAEKIQRLLEEGVEPQEIAVIYRTNVQGGAFARALYRKGIPYRLRDGGSNIYTHWIARDLLAYLHLAENEDSDSALLRILNKPKRYISKELLEEAQRMPYGLLRSLFVCPSLKKWQEEPLLRLREDLAQIRKRAPYEALRYIRNVTGYDEYLNDYAAFRKANLPHFLEIADEITETAKDADNCSAFEKRLEEMSRQMQEQQKAPQGPAVSLTTIHSAKGLEFTAVFLPSLAEGILPYEKGREGAALEEERRLFYVGLTRARSRLFLSFCGKRYERQMKPSRFLGEMGLPAGVFLKENDKKS